MGSKEKLVGSELLQWTIWQTWESGRGVEASRPKVSRTEGLSRIHPIFKQDLRDQQTGNWMDFCTAAPCLW